VKKILDMCCGSKMFYFDKQNKDLITIDNRELLTNLCDGRVLEIKPDIIADFRKLPFKNKSFYLVVFDPPHLIQIGAKSWLAQKYGMLNKNTWQEDLKKGFNEAMRVLKPNGTLIFKWNEEQIKLSEILKLSPMPLFGHKKLKTHFLVFFKGGK